ncbi:transcriptional regulator [Mannheimia bovis]|uniref:Helix-turn-helix domain-containing protein n=1 Tax=Mannheimia bovis TaxID=2770636 RepID=A0A7H1BZV7_9PAST|nr:Cro/CI family transcriptional regulator [Mannheimia bovis]QNS14262.1 helix-turn-helix domain-containing protein [Mannheimia bovis]
MNESIKKAVSILGSQTNLANACGVTQGAVQKWLNGGGISAEYLLKIESATNGQVTIRAICEELEK